MGPHSRTYPSRSWQGSLTLVSAHSLDALVMFPDLATILASTPGLPVVTVPMGALGAEAATRRVDGSGDPGAEPLVLTVPGFPLGVSFVGEAWSEEQLIGYAYAYEQALKRRRESWSRLSSPSPTLILFCSTIEWRADGLGYMDVILPEACTDLH